LEGRARAQLYTRAHPRFLAGHTLYQKRDMCGPPIVASPALIITTNTHPLAHIEADVQQMRESR